MASVSVWLVGVVILWVNLTVGHGSRRQAKSDADKDEILSLPGLRYKPQFRHYSGYLSATGPRKFFYWFVESAGNPSEDPLMLWLNGGPGCSSFLGLLVEHGPFLVQEGGCGLKENPYSWNKVGPSSRAKVYALPPTRGAKLVAVTPGLTRMGWSKAFNKLVANMLYLESPSGVGYSYTENDNYTTNDDLTAIDNHWALKSFFQKFPRFSKNPFYISGESYGGIYVPLLAVRVLEDPKFNFKGIAIGNGVVDFDVAYSSRYFYAYYHGVISTTAWERFLDNCCQGDDLRCRIQWSAGSPACKAARRKMDDEMRPLGIYNLYAECPGGVPHSMGVPGYPQADNLDTTSQTEQEFESFAMCVDHDALTTYMNRLDVREALHAKLKKEKPWSVCGGVRGHYNQLYRDVKKQLLTLIRAKKLQILLYNGDWDMLCSYLSIQWVVDDLKVQPSHPRRPWYYTDTDGTQQVAGFVKVFDQLTVATLKGAGHTAPADKPLQALLMISRFMKGELLP